jgi:hypothetical protein
VHLLPAGRSGHRVIDASAGPISHRIADGSAAVLIGR